MMLCSAFRLHRCQCVDVSRISFPHDGSGMICITGIQSWVPFNVTLALSSIEIGTHAQCLFKIGCSQV